MKKNLLWMFLLFCAVSFLPSCSDDDDKREFVGTEFDGVYKGTLDVKAPTLDIDAKDIPQKVYITKVGENLFKLQLKNFSFGEFILGDIEVSDLITVKNGNNCTFNGSDELSLIVGKCNVAVNGSIQDNKTDISIDVTVLDGAFQDLNVDVKFKGTKLTADQSSDAKITAFKIDTATVIGESIIDENKIYISVADTVENDELKFAPEITISDKATITPKSGVVQDFSSPVIYKVVSEDGITTTTYTVSIKEKVAYYSFDKWKVANPTDEAKKQYKVTDGDSWANSNSAITLIRLYQGLYDEGPFPIQDTIGKSNRGASISTIYTTGKDLGFLGAIPTITAGTMFTGIFKVTSITKPLTSTKFGIPYDRKPVSFRGWYKYTPGETYYVAQDKINEAVKDDTKKDECSIVAVLYEIQNDTDVLDGTNLNKATNVVLRAELFDGNKVSEWKKFDIPFQEMNGLTYSPDKKYKLAVVCSSSKDGDKYCGAPGSTLMIDEFEVVVEK